MTNELPGGKMDLNFCSFPEFVFRSIQCSCLKIKDGVMGILKVQHRIPVIHVAKSHISLRSETLVI